MLGDEAVPHADSLLAALTKHLEVKLAFGETPSHWLPRANAALANRLLPHLSEKGERDMIVLRNEVGLRHPTGELETRQISLVVYGEALTAMLKVNFWKIRFMSFLRFAP